ncbi:MAG: MATE family efflux transporter [Prevotella sp.]|nr:MATE family efflux transporter [Prevotella sp.]
MSNNKQAALELGTKPVGRLLLQYALPAIVAMVASSLYNMVDSIFIGQGVGALAISGLAITFPFMNLSAAFGAAIGVGSSAFLSVKLGQRDYDIANKILGNCVMLNIIIGIVFGGVGLLFLDPILRFFGASDATLPYAREYMVVILIGNAVTHLYLGLNAVMRAAGKPRVAMYITIFTVVINAILDPLFIYTLRLGIRGAAYATILSQLMALMWQWKLFGNRKEFLHFDYGKFRVEMPIVRNIISIGISPFSMNACACLVVIFINNSLMKYGGDMAVGAYGIANRVAFIFVMVTMGVCQGMQPIAGYNYGAQNYNRMLEVLRLAVIAGTLVCAVGFVIAIFFPEPCVRLFTTDVELIEKSVVAMRYIMALFVIIGAQMVITNFFQSIGKAKVSIFLSLSRQLIFLVPAIAILPPLMGLNGVWLAMPLSDGVAAVMAYAMLWIYVRRLKGEKKYGFVDER